MYRYETYNLNVVIISEIIHKNKLQNIATIKGLKKNSSVSVPHNFKSSYNHISDSIRQIKKDIIQHSVGSFDQNIIYVPDRVSGYFYIDNKASINPNNMKKLTPTSFATGVNNGNIPKITTFNNISHTIGVDDLEWRDAINPNITMSVKAHFNEIDQNALMQLNTHKMCQIGRLFFIKDKHQLFLDQNFDLYIVMGELRSVKYTTQKCYKIKNYVHRALIICLLLHDKDLKSYLDYLNDHHEYDIKTTFNVNHDVYISRIKRNNILIHYGIANDEESALKQMIFHMSYSILFDVKLPNSLSSSTSSLSMSSAFNVNQPVFKPMDLTNDIFHTTTRVQSPPEDIRNVFEDLHFEDDIQDESILSNNKSNINLDEVIGIINEQNKKLSSIRKEIDEMIYSNHKLLDLLNKCG